MNQTLRIQPHPLQCPNCEQDSIRYERFVGNLEAGEYICEDCSWSMDAFTGKITNQGEPISPDEPIQNSKMKFIYLQNQKIL